mgnify:CR=1 FL=1
MKQSVIIQQEKEKFQGYLETNGIVYSEMLEIFPEETTDDFLYRVWEMRNRGELLGCASQRFQDSRRTNDLLNKLKSKKNEVYFSLVGPVKSQSDMLALGSLPRNLIKTIGKYVTSVYDEYATKFQPSQ